MHVIGCYCSGQLSSCALLRQSISWIYHLAVVSVPITIKKKPRYHRYNIYFSDLGHLMSWHHFLSKIVPGPIVPTVWKCIFD